MFIPTWIVNLLATLAALAALAFLVAGLLVALGWALNKATVAIRQIMTFYGMWASFVNYMRVILNAADGGREWFNRFLSPQSDEEVDSDPAPYFRIIPRPEAYRWWMRPIGIKRPKAEDPK